MTLTIKQYKLATGLLLMALSVSLVGWASQAGYFNSLYATTPSPPPPRPPPLGFAPISILWTFNQSVYNSFFTHAGIIHAFIIGNNTCAVPLPGTFVCGQNVLLDQIAMDCNGFALSCQAHSNALFPLPKPPAEIFLKISIERIFYTGTVVGLREWKIMLPDELYTQQCTGQIVLPNTAIGLPELCVRQQ